MKNSRKLVNIRINMRYTINMWINLKYSHELVWNNWSVYGRFICLDDSILQSSGDCGIVRDGITQAVNCESERYVSCKIKGKLKHLILKT